MIQGLKLAFTGQEIRRAIDERIARLEAAIQFKRDEIDGKIEPRGEVHWQVSVEEVQQEIAILQHRIDVQTMYRDRLVPSETYLLGKRAMRRANLLPPEPPPLVPDMGDNENDYHSILQWVRNSVNAYAAADCRLGLRLDGVQM